MTTARRHIDQYFVDLLPHVASRSTCVRRAVGAIITNAKHQILATGYNGVPSGVKHCTSEPCPGALSKAGDTTLCEAVHAEQNAILQCRHLDEATTIYCSCTPCFVCMKMLLNTPINRIVAIEQYNDARAIEIWIRQQRVLKMHTYSA